MKLSSFGQLKPNIITVEFVIEQGTLKDGVWVGRETVEVDLAELTIVEFESVFSELERPAPPEVVENTVKKKLFDDVDYQQELNRYGDNLQWLRVCKSLEKAGFMDFQGKKPLEQLEILRNQFFWLIRGLSNALNTSVLQKESKIKNLADSFPAGDGADSGGV